MKTKISLIIITLLVIMSCASTKLANEKTMFVSAETKICQAGMMEKECLLVKYSKDQKDWLYFYSNIEGFNYEKGYEYELIIKEEKVSNPPADGSSIKYFLVKEVSKVKVM